MLDTRMAGTYSDTTTPTNIAAIQLDTIGTISEAGATK